MTEVKEVFAPVNDEMTKREIMQHLGRDHGITSVGGYMLGSNCKATKEQLIAHHTASHEVLDDPNRYFTDTSRHARVDKDSTDAYYVMAPGKTSMIRKPRTDHIHVQISATEVQMDMVEKAKMNQRLSDKPLSATERKILTELVNNDFNHTKQQMRELAADALQVELDEIRSRHQTKIEEENAIIQKLKKIRDDAQEKIDKVRSDLAEKGIKLSGYGLGSPNVSFTYETREKEITESKNRNKEMLERGFMTLERQRLVALRRVLVSGITEEAAGLLEEIPSAQSLMTQAFQDSTKAIES